MKNTFSNLMAVSLLGLESTSIYESESFVYGKSSAIKVDLVYSFNQTHIIQLDENVG
jgi:pectate lyase